MSKTTSYFSKMERFGFSGCVVCEQSWRDNKHIHNVCVFEIFQHMRGQIDDQGAKLHNIDGHLFVLFDDCAADTQADQIYLLLVSNIAGFELVADIRCVDNENEPNRSHTGT